MTTAEVLLQDYDMEMGMTRRTLERVPEDKPDYKPHEKSMPMGKLTMHVATLPLFGKIILTTPSLDLANTDIPHPDLTFRSRDAALAAFDAASAEARAALAAASDANLATTWKFSFGDKVISDSVRSLAFRHMFFNHLIHHRAQLGVYLRLNDLPVPAVYGPSADEPFKP
jgi:uncharacterized damage-inducible protein DinB